MQEIKFYEGASNSSSAQTIISNADVSFKVLELFDANFASFNADYDLAIKSIKSAVSELSEVLKIQDDAVFNELAKDALANAAQISELAANVGAREVQMLATQKQIAKSLGANLDNASVSEVKKVFIEQVAAKLGLESSEIELANTAALKANAAAMMAEVMAKDEALAKEITTSANKESKASEDAISTKANAKAAIASSIANKKLASISAKLQSAKAKLEANAKDAEAIALVAVYEKMQDLAKEDKTSIVTKAKSIALAAKEEAIKAASAAKAAAIEANKAAIVAASTGLDKDYIAANKAAAEAQYKAYVAAKQEIKAKEEQKLAKSIEAEKAAIDEVKAAVEKGENPQDALNKVVLPKDTEIDDLKKAAEATIGPTLGGGGTSYQDIKIDVNVDGEHLSFNQNEWSEIVRMVVWEHPELNGASDNEIAANASLGMLSIANADVDELSFEALAVGAFMGNLKAPKHWSLKQAVEYKNYITGGLKGARPDFANEVKEVKIGTGAGEKASTTKVSDLLTGTDNKMVFIFDENAKLLGELVQFKTIDNTTKQIFVAANPTDVTDEYFVINDVSANATLADFKAAVQTPSFETFKAFKDSQNVVKVDDHYVIDYSDTNAPAIKAIVYGNITKAAITGLDLSAISEGKITQPSEVGIKLGGYNKASINGFKVMNDSESGTYYEKDGYKFYGNADGLLFMDPSEVKATAELTIADLRKMGFTLVENEDLAIFNIINDTPILKNANSVKGYLANSVKLSELDNLAKAAITPDTDDANHAYGMAYDGTNNKITTVDGVEIAGADKELFDELTSILYGKSHASVELPKRVKIFESFYVKDLDMAINAASEHKASKEKASKSADEFKADYLKNITLKAPGSSKEAAHINTDISDYIAEFATLRVAAEFLQNPTLGNMLIAGDENSLKLKVLNIHEDGTHSYEYYPVYNQVTAALVDHIKLSKDIKVTDVIKMLSDGKLADAQASKYTSAEEEQNVKAVLAQGFLHEKGLLYKLVSEGDSSVIKAGHDEGYLFKVDLSNDNDDQEWVIAGVDDERTDTYILDVSGIDNTSKTIKLDTPFNIFGEEHNVAIKLGKGTYEIDLPKNPMGGGVFVGGADASDKVVLHFDALAAGVASTKVGYFEANGHYYAYSSAVNSNKLADISIKELSKANYESYKADSSKTWASISEDTIKLDANALDTFIDAIESDSTLGATKGATYKIAVKVDNEDDEIFNELGINQAAKDAAYLLLNVGEADNHNDATGAFVVGLAGAITLDTANHTISLAGPAAN